MSATGIDNPMLWTDLTVIGAATLGSFTRTMIPYWAKLKENPEIIFEKKFLGTAILGFLGAIGIGLGLFPVLVETVPVNSMSLAGIFAIVFLAALGANHAVNYGIDQASKAATATKSDDSSTTTEAAAKGQP